MRDHPSFSLAPQKISLQIPPVNTQNNTPEKLCQQKSKAEEQKPEKEPNSRVNPKSLYIFLFFFGPCFLNYITHTHARFGSSDQRNSIGMRLLFGTLAKWVGSVRPVKNLSHYPIGPHSS